MYKYAIEEAHHTHKARVDDFWPHVRRVELNDEHVHLHGRFVKALLYLWLVPFSVKRHQVDASVAMLRKGFAQSDTGHSAFLWTAASG